jgi:energy-coupling factor transporter ATP-binding protein EcfA2
MRGIIREVGRAGISLSANLVEYRNSRETLFRFGRVLSYWGPATFKGETTQLTASVSTSPCRYCILSENITWSRSEKLTLNTSVKSIMPSHLIRSIRIDNLFGLYSYKLPVEGFLSDASILYGDNGVGKSTILKLVFHLLSPSGNSGHRTALLEANFSYLEVNLTNDICVSAKKESNTKNDFVVHKVERDKQLLAIWEHHIDHLRVEDGTERYLYLSSDGKVVSRRRTNERLRAGTPQGEEAFLDALQKYCPKVFILNAERRLYSDEISDSQNETELRSVFRRNETKNATDIVARSRQIALANALRRVATWINRRTILASNEGLTNVNEVYRNILRQIKHDGSDLISELEISDLSRRLEAITDRTAEFSKYEIQNTVSTTDFKNALTSKSEYQTELSARLLKPYVESLEARIAALNSIYDIVNKFIQIVNGMLNDKYITYTMTTGFSILNIKGDELEVEHLSSGEQQLLLLLSHILVARDQPSVFIVDEPELSLNVKWQRKLITNLLELTYGSKIQFLLATHSLELLAQHMDRVVQLSNRQAL